MISSTWAPPRTWPPCTPVLAASPAPSRDHQRTGPARRASLKPTGRLKIPRKSYRSLTLWGSAESQCCLIKRFNLHSSHSLGTPEQPWFPPCLFRRGLRTFLSPAGTREVGSDSDKTLSAQAEVGGADERQAALGRQDPQGTGPSPEGPHCPWSFIPPHRQGKGRSYFVKY